MDDAGSGPVRRFVCFGTTLVGVGEVRLSPLPWPATVGTTPATRGEASIILFNTLDTSYVVWQPGKAADRGLLQQFASVCEPLI